MEFLIVALVLQITSVLAKQSNPIHNAEATTGLDQVDLAILDPDCVSEELYEETCEELWGGATTKTMVKQYHRIRSEIANADEECEGSVHVQVIRESMTHLCGQEETDFKYRLTDFDRTSRKQESQPVQKETRPTTDTSSDSEEQDAYNTRYKAQDQSSFKQGTSAGAFQQDSRRSGAKNPYFSFGDGRRYSQDPRYPEGARFPGDPPYGGFAQYSGDKGYGFSSQQQRGDTPYSGYDQYNGYQGYGSSNYQQHRHTYYPGHGGYSGYDGYGSSSRQQSEAQRNRAFPQFQERNEPYRGAHGYYDPRSAPMFEQKGLYRSRQQQQGQQQQRQQRNDVRFSDQPINRFNGRGSRQAEEDLWQQQRAQQQYRQWQEREYERQQQEGWQGQQRRQQRQERRQQWEEDMRRQGYDPREGTRTYTQGASYQTQGTNSQTARQEEEGVVQDDSGSDSSLEIPGRNARNVRGQTQGTRSQPARQVEEEETKDDTSSDSSLEIKGRNAKPRHKAPPAQQTRGQAFTRQNDDYDSDLDSPVYYSESSEEVVESEDEAEGNQAQAAADAGGYQSSYGDYDGASSVESSPRRRGTFGGQRAGGTAQPNRAGGGNNQPPPPNNPRNRATSQPAQNTNARGDVPRVEHTQRLRIGGGSNNAMVPANRETRVGNTSKERGMVASSNHVARYNH